MLEHFNTSDRGEEVFRLAAVPRHEPAATLLRRGVDTENLQATLSGLAELPSPLTPEQVLDHVFIAKPEAEMPFSKGRFGDGSIPVFYSALEEDTCQRELAFHIQGELAEQFQDASRYPRSFCLIRCLYSGVTSDLRGHEVEHPELTSETAAGYPFCQHLGLRAVEKGIDGFLAPSARNQGGTCTPVFTRNTLSRPTIEARTRVSLSASAKLKFQKE